jgi:predicted transcriptional regulator
MALDLDKEAVRAIVDATIKELMRNGMLKRVGDIAYSDTVEMLRAYYAHAKKDAALTAAIAAVRADTYFEIIPLYFRDGYTIERLAEEFSVDTSTISRNKKRLCLEIYSMLE